MNQIIQKAVEELQGYLRNWAIVEPETTLILGNVRRLLTEAYMAGRSERDEELFNACGGDEDAVDTLRAILEQAKQSPTQCCENCRLLESPPCRFCPCHSVKDNN